MQRASTDAQTVRLRVQVIDTKPQVLDLNVPMYIPAHDVAKRVVRDAGLPEYWPDRRRRRYWLRARGRLLAEDERLDQVGVVNGELIHMLPEPPAGSGVVEQIPDYPETRDYPARGNLAIAVGLTALVAWAAMWGFALAAERTAWVVTLPGVGLGLMACSLSRHLFGGQGGEPRVAAVGMALALPSMALALAVPVLLGEPVGDVVAESIAGVVTTLVGVLMGWLAWWGAVEPLPPLELQAAQAQVDPAAQILPCFICGQGADPSVRMPCQHGCGHVFHTGCHQARVAVAQPDPSRCAVCGAGLRAG